MAEGYLGEIRVFATSKIPSGWMACNGQQIEIAQYQGLYALIGQQYGGSGNTFALPNLQGRLIAGIGQGFGLSAYTLGQTFGSDHVSLTADQTNHSHGLLASSTPAASLSPQSNVFAAASPDFAEYVPADVSAVLRPMDPVLLSTEGGPIPHLNVMPSLAFNYIICVNGIYPAFD